MEEDRTFVHRALQIEDLQIHQFPDSPTRDHPQFQRPVPPWFEDEPHAVYAQLLAASLHPGTRVHVLEHTPDRIRFEADGEERILAPVLAANLSVIAQSAEEETEPPFERLSRVDLGDRVRVTGIAAACRGRERRRMLDLGIVPGTIIEPEMNSPGGDPMAYRIRGTLIALRHEQADLIRIERLAPA